MAPHSSTLVWKIPWTEEPGGLQTMGSWRVGHNWAASLSLFSFMHWRRIWQPTPVFLPGDPQEPGGLWSVGLHRVGNDWSDLAAATEWSQCQDSLLEENLKENAVLKFLLMTELSAQDTGFGGETLRMNIFKLNWAFQFLVSLSKVWKR